MNNYKKINHCRKCDVEAECAWNDWHLYNENDPCCPNWKEGHKQFKQFLKDEGYIS